MKLRDQEEKSLWISATLTALGGMASSETTMYPQHGKLAAEIADRVIAEFRERARVPGEKVILKNEDVPESTS